MAIMAARSTGSAYLNPYSKTGTIRGQEYKQGDFIWITDHNHSNGGLSEQFVFKGLDEAAGIVDVWVIEREKDGYVRNQTRSFHLERVITETDMGEMKMAKAQAKSEKAKAARKPKEGVCEFTGKPTKGGRFLPGQDAALKGALLTVAKSQGAGSVEAAAELIARNWPTKSLDAVAVKAGKAMAMTEDQVQTRVKTRLAKVAKGMSPLEAVGVKPKVAA